MKPVLRLSTLAIAAVVILSSCASLPAHLTQGAPVKPEPLKLTVGYDLAFLRVDLKRATHPVVRLVLEPDANGVVKRQPEIFPVDNPYSYLVIELGNGLIVDRNGNVDLDLLRFFNFEAKGSYRLTEHFAGALPAGMVLVKDGATFERRGTGIVVQHLTATITGDTAALSGLPLHPHARIVRTPDSVTYEPSGRPAASSITISRVSSDSLAFKRRGAKTIFRMTDPNHVDSTSGIAVARRGGKIDIVEHAPGGIAASFVFERTQNGCIITSRDGYGTIRVMRSGSEIYVLRNGRVAATVTIEAP